MDAAEDWIFVRQDPERKISFEEIVSTAFWNGYHLSATGWFQPEPVAWDRSTGQGDAFPSYSYACVVAEVEIDQITGLAVVKRLVLVHDIGRVVHRGAAEGALLFGHGIAPCERTGETAIGWPSWNGQAIAGVDRADASRLATSGARSYTLLGSSESRP